MKPSETMSKQLDYSKWDSIGDSDSEDEKASPAAAPGRAHAAGDPGASERDDDIDNTKLSDLHGLKPVQTSRAWQEIERLQLLADNLFFTAEQSQNTPDYQKAHWHYTEVLRLVQGALLVEQKAAEAQATVNKEKGKGSSSGSGGSSCSSSGSKISAIAARKHVAACHLNSACCCIRAKKWTEAAQHCDEALSDTFKSHTLADLQAIDELRARHLRV